MVVILSIFDLKIGPTAVIVIPPSFSREMADENAKTLDIQSLPTEFVVKEYPSSGLKSINLQFNIPSPVSPRGKFVNLQLSAFISETYPAEKLVRAKLIECKNKLLGDESAFAAFQTVFADETAKEASFNKRDAVEKLMKWLDSEIKVSMPETSAVVVARSSIPGNLSFPPDFRGGASRGPGTLEDALVIYRKDSDGAITIKVLPSTRRVIKVRVIAENFTPKLMVELMECARNLKLLYTTGLCQETTGKCLHESYFSIDSDGAADQKSIAVRLSIFQFVKQYDVDVLSSSRA